MQVGSAIGLAFSLLFSFSNPAQNIIEIGTVHLVVNSRFVFLTIQAILGTLVGAWFGMAFDSVSTYKKSAYQRQSR